MAILIEKYLRKKYEISIWQDPNRYRAMVWKRSSDTGLFATLVCQMHSKYKDRLLSRALAWCDEQP